MSPVNFRYIQQQNNRQIVVYMCLIPLITSTADSAMKESEIYFMCFETHLGNISSQKSAND
jgi:hypothetical protein